MRSKRPRLPGLLLTVAVLVLGILLPNAAWSERGPVAHGATVKAEDAVQARVIVKYKADSALMRSLSAGGGVGARPLHAAVLSQRLRVPLSDGWVLGRRTQSLRGSGLSSARLAEQLAAQPDVEWAVPDQRRYITALPNDPLLADNQPSTTPVVGQWYLRAPNSTIVSAINAVGAWDLNPGSAAITVAVLDTGILSSHPDLAGKLQPNGLGGYGYDFVHDIATANDGDGRDPSSEDPGDWTTVGECSLGEAAANSSWHGTQVAGLIGAATDNGIGMASVGRKVMLLPLRVLGRCGGYDSDIIAAMRWAAGVSSDVGFGTPVTLVNAHPAKVINLSLGAIGTCPASYRDVVAEVNASGVSVVAAAGNAVGAAVDAPANCAGVIAVAGLRHVGTKVGYSSVGPEVAIAAPAGNCVNASGSCLYPLITTSNTGTEAPLTTIPLTSASAYVYTGGGANASLGTSFSAPLVAGTVGLMLSQNPVLTPAGVKAVLQASARPFPTSGGETLATTCHAPGTATQIECYCTTSTCGAGMLSTAGAVARAFDPTVAITASTTTPTVGTPVVLDGGATVVYAGHNISSYQWTISAGATSASFVGATNAASATLNTTAVGSVTVQLAVTDNSGATATGSVSITVGAAPVVTGSSGGGALGWDWLPGLAAVAGMLLVSRSRRKRADRCPGNNSGILR